MKFYLIATLDADYGLVPAATAEAAAKALADEIGQPVTLRHPTTDRVIGTVKPDRRLP